MATLRAKVNKMAVDWEALFVVNAKELLTVFFVHRAVERVYFYYDLNNGKLKLSLFCIFMKTIRK